MENWGGKHTKIKLQVLLDYCTAYNKVMQNQTYFNLYYIDCFAGKGTVRTKSNEQFDGSAKLLLESNFNFKKYYFFEKDKNNFRSLNKLIEASNKDAVCYNGDANILLPKIIDDTHETSARYLIFIDPYGLNQYFETFQKISKKAKFDILYLFNVRGAERSLAISEEKIVELHEQCLQKIIGSKKYRNLYTESPQQDLFKEKPEIIRNHNIGSQLVELYLRELSKLFSYCTSICRLGRKGNAFELIYILNNDSQQAKSAAKRITDSLKKKYS